MPKARKLTPTQYRILQNIRDYDGNSVAVGCHGLSQHGGFGRSCQLMERRGWIKYLSTPYHYELTDEGQQVLAEIEAGKETVEMAATVRRLFRDAGYIEKGSLAPWGWTVSVGTRPGIVRVDYTPRLPTSSVKIGNGRVSEYVRTLQKNGFDVRRVPGATSVDSLLVMNK